MRISAVVIAFLMSVVLTPVVAQTGIGGILEIWLKARESADAPNDQKVPLYQKSKALVVGMDHYNNARNCFLFNSEGSSRGSRVARTLTPNGCSADINRIASS